MRMHCAHTYTYTTSRPGLNLNGMCSFTVAAASFLGGEEKNLRLAYRLTSNRSVTPHGCVGIVVGIVSVVAIRAFIIDDAGIRLFQQRADGLVVKLVVGQHIVDIVLHGLDHRHIMPGMLGMIAFWLYYWLLSKKINPMVLIVATMVVGIIGAFFGVLA